MRPDFNDLVGTDLGPDERARLERVHELLVAAGPPPDDVPAPAAPSPQRHRWAALAIAAALAITAFAMGAALTGADDANVDFRVSLQGVGGFEDASAVLTVYDLDAAGNWPMKLEAQDLSPLPERPFELWLTRNSELIASCGTFRTDSTGSAIVRLNAPYRFDDFDGWVVVEAGTDGLIMMEG